MVRFREIFACAKTYCTYVFYTTFTIFVWLCWSITKKWMHVFALLGWIKSTKNIIFLVWNTNLKLVTTVKMIYVIFQQFYESFDTVC